METRASPPLLLREVDHASDRSDALDVLASAGWARDRLADWVATGTLLELYDPADGVPRGAALVEIIHDGVYQLRAWATSIDMTDPAVSGRLVQAISDALRRAGGRRVVASVGDADPQRLALLLEAGFRFVSVERDASDAAHVGRCDGSRDLIWMDQDL